MPWLLAAAAGAPGAAPGAITSLSPGSPVWRALSPRQRRAIQRSRWKRPLRDDGLRRLREIVSDYQGCLDGLSTDGRRAIVLRAGLFGRQPASRQTVARRLGISRARALRLERSSLRLLRRAGARGMCDGAAAVAARERATALFGEPGPVTRIEPFDDVAATNARESGEPDRAEPPRGGVLGQASRGSGVVPDLDEGLDAAPEVLLLTMLLLLGSLAAAMLAARRLALASVPPGFLAPGERPLLFLDVDGVIALDPWTADLPPGAARAIDRDGIYVPDEAGELICALASRFDIVWATGWEGHANSRFRSPLDLDEDLPAVSFGRKARHGSAEWKIKRIARYAQHRPLAWIDDHLDSRHDRWAWAREAPTMLVRADPRRGITRQQVDHLLAWADRVAPRAVEAAASGSRGRAA